MNLEMPTPTTPETVKPQWTEHLKEAEAKADAEIKKLETEVKDEVKKIETEVKEVVNGKSH